MTDKKPELSDAMKKKLEPKKFTKNPILGTKFTIAVSSAKGGVGKSTFATNLALALKQVGCKVGLLDADIYGPSIPKMFDINEKPKSDGQKLEPITKYDIQCMSIGFLADQQTPMIWRGPMVTSAIKTFTQKVNWNNLDFIIVDMPPGTGDTQLTFSQEIKMDGAIIVSTPQEVELLDVKRGIKMFDKLGVKILGLVDNMSFFTGDDGKKYKIFGEGGVRKTAEEFEKEFLGEIPINPEVGKCGDEGKPIVEANPEHKISKIYLNFAKKNSTIPILRKEFIIDEFQIIESKSIGADAVLLIASILNENEIINLSRLAKENNLDVLIEVHTIEELKKSLVELILPFFFQA